MRRWLFAALTGLFPLIGWAQAFPARFIREDNARWAKIIQQAGIKGD